MLHGLVAFPEPVEGPTGVARRGGRDTRVPEGPFFTEVVPLGAKVRKGNDPVRGNFCVKATAAVFKFRHRNGKGALFGRGFGG